MRPASILVVFALAAARAPAHRLDEYLQATLVSVGNGRVEMQMTLTPGVAALPAVLSAIDLDRDGRISEAEQHGYAERVVGDLSIRVDERPARPRLVSYRFPAMDRMREGLGEIRLEFVAAAPAGTRKRTLVIENHHQPAIAAYQVNCLLPRDPAIRVSAQKRNYLQSRYELDWEDAAARPEWVASVVWVFPFALLLAGRLAYARRGRMVRNGTPGNRGDGSALDSGRGECARGGGSARAAAGIYDRDDDARPAL